MQNSAVLWLNCSLLRSARCIQTVSSQIERLQLRAPQTTPFFYNNVKVFSLSTSRLFGSWWNWTQMQFWNTNASSYWKSRKDISHKYTKIAFMTRILYLWPSFLQLFRFRSPSFYTIITGICVRFCQLSFLKSASILWLYIENVLQIKL